MIVLEESTEVSLRSLIKRVWTYLDVSRGRDPKTVRGEVEDLISRHRLI